MRKRFPSLALLCICVLAPAHSHAQFQEPTKEELQMTQDPKAPGADATYLYREEITDDALHFLGYYVRVKVLTERGKELATVRIPYEHGVDTVNDIQGRTIHADGTVIPLTAKPADLMDFKAKDYQVNSVVITLPSVEVGSILEYRLKIRSPDYRVSQPEWDIQQKYFVHKAHYSFHPFLSPGEYVSDGHGDSLNRLMYGSRVPPPIVINYDKNKNVYTLDVTDVPAIPDEDWMPPLNTLKYRVKFYYTNAETGPEFWQDAGKKWAKRTQDFANPSGTLKLAVAEIVAPTDTEEQKARKIYAAVQKLDNTVFNRKKSQAERKKEKLKEIRTAEDVWKQKSGSDDDITLLFVALGRAAGLKVFAAQVVDRNHAMFDDHYLSTSQLDDYLAIVVLDGKDVYLDPGQKMCPFGQLHWKHTLATGFRQTESGPAPVTTPSNSYKTAVVQRVADLKVEPDGAVSGTVRFLMTGPDAMYWRQLAIQNDQEEVKKRFNEDTQDDFPDGVRGELDHFLALDDYTSNLLAVVKVSGNIGSATGKRFFLPGLFFEARAKHPFVAQDKRVSPIDVHYSKTEEDDVTYHLPPGFSVESAPQPSNPMWPTHAILKISETTGPDSVNVLRTLVYNFTLLPPADYSSIHEFYQKVATADQQQLVLTHSSVAKGN